MLRGALVKLLALKGTSGVARAHGSLSPPWVALEPHSLGGFDGLRSDTVQLGCCGLWTPHICDAGRDGCGGRKL